MQGYEEKKNAYIAAQGEAVYHVCEQTVNSNVVVYIVSGPVEMSVERFWRMIWEYEVKTIVMLTQCSEAGKVCILEKRCVCQKKALVQHCCHVCTVHSSTHIQHIHVHIVA